MNKIIKNISALTLLIVSLGSSVNASKKFGDKIAYTLNIVRSSKDGNQAVLFRGQPEISKFNVLAGERCSVAKCRIRKSSCSN